MSDLLCEVRYEVDPTRESPGFVSGTLMVYGERAKNIPERFLPGALEWPADGININAQHNREAPVVRVTPYVEGKRVEIRAALPNTTAGRDTRENIKTGVYRGLSVEFERASVEATMVGGIRTIKRAKLVRAAFVDSPEYASATVAVRHEDDDEYLALVRRLAIWL